MAYNPYSDVNSIYKLKGKWEEANKAGNTDEKNNVAATAQAYYKNLRQNGYADVADALTASNYTQAKSINDKWAKMGKTSTRDYLYSLGKSKGLSQSDIDSLIGWDNQTKEVSFGGKKIGAPDTIVDGVSYWSDTSVLDKAFDDYINRSGTVRTKSAAVDQENEKLFAKYDQEYEDLKTTNPFETETAKAILAKYDLSGLQGRDNEVASNAGSNGGNIDSFASANALRQQAALVNQGQMVVLEEYQQKLDHARSLLSDMGVNIDRVFNQDETAKNNDVARKSEIASVSGYTPDEWVVSNNPYMNEDGTIKDEYKNIDFSAVMANAKAAGNTEAYNAAAQARYYKIMGNYGAYGKYDDGNYVVPGQRRTAEYDLTKQQIDSAERIAKGENDTAVVLADKEANSAMALADKEAASAIDQINAQTQGQKEIIAETAKYSSNGSDDYAAYNVLLSMWPVSETEKRAFIEEFIKPIYEGKQTITPEGLKQLIVTNTEKYNIDIDDAQKICQAFDVSTEWLNEYRDRTDADGNTSEGREGRYGGMVKK